MGGQSQGSAGASQGVRAELEADSRRPGGRGKARGGSLADHVVGRLGQKSIRVLLWLGAQRQLARGGASPRGSLFDHSPMALVFRV